MKQLEKLGLKQWFPTTFHEKSGKFLRLDICTLQIMTILLRNMTQTMTHNEKHNIFLTFSKIPTQSTTTLPNIWVWIKLQYFSKNG
jgi:hypothetical protein